MKFKVTKIATAVAAGLGVSVAGMNVARADAVLFPYFAVSSTVTSVVTSINLARQGAVSSVNPQTLHYRLYYKRGASADSLTATCEEFNVRRITSPNDVVTFDLLGKYGDELGVLGEPANRQQKAKYSPNQSFALMKGLTPARGFMVIDNDEAVNAPFEPSLFGEIMLIDYAEGAVWGYAAYNAAPSGLPYNFEDGAENNGEVLAGNRAITAAAPNGGTSPAVPTNILPLNSQTPDKDAVITKFFVTPIDHWVTVGGAPQVARIPSQLNPALSTRVQLQVSFDTATINDVMFDRDENPVSGQTPRTVTCVGAVLVDDLLSAGALQEIGQYGGWSGVEVRSPGPLANFNAAGVVSSRTDNTNQAVVIKLEYNPDGKFLNDTFKGAFNNSIWLRYGIRESIRQPAAVQTAAVIASPVSHG